LKEGEGRKEGQISDVTGRKKERISLFNAARGRYALRPPLLAPGVLVSTVRWLSSSSLAVAHVCVYSMHA
jgi:hypothetical protein